MKKILVLTTSLSQGGITSFLIPLTNLLNDLGNEVTLAYTDDKGEFLNRINPAVKRLQFDTPSRNSAIIAWVCNLAFYDMARVLFRKSTQKPHYPSVQRLSYISAKNTLFTSDVYDIAISTTEGFCNALVATKVNAKKKIGWIHPDMSAIGLDLKAGQYLLDKFEKVVTVSESGCNTLRRFFPKEQEKFLHIENLMDSDNICKRGGESIDDMPLLEGCRNIVTVCRITNDSKRLDRVIKVAIILNEKRFKFRWYIVGDGPDVANIKSLIEKNNLQDSVIMLGGRNNALPYIKQADCFVLTSQFEGKPVVIEEAKILHTPVIVTEYSSAKVQVIPEVGVVVPNVDGLLEEYIAHLLLDDVLIKKLKETCLSFSYDNKKSIDSVKTLIK